MRLLIEVQRQVNQIYATQKYGRTKRLSKEEKAAIEIVVRLSDEHSTWFGVDLDDVLNTVLSEGVSKMDGTDLTIVILGISLILGTCYVAKLRYKT